MPVEAFECINERKEELGTVCLTNSQEPSSSPHPFCHQRRHHLPLLSTFPDALPLPLRLTLASSYSQICPRCHVRHIDEAGNEGYGRVPTELKQLHDILYGRFGHQGYQ